CCAPASGRREAPKIGRCRHEAHLQSALGRVLLAIACGGPELERTARDPAGPGEVATTVESALGEPGCTGVRADATIQGFGDAETGTAYGQGNCSRTFVVDIESYAPADA